MRPAKFRNRPSLSVLRRPAVSIGGILSVLLVVLASMAFADPPEPEPTEQITLNGLRQHALRLGLTPPESLPWINEKGESVYKARQDAWRQDPEAYAKWVMGQSPDETGQGTNAALAGTQN